MHGYNDQALNFQYSSFLVELILIFIHFDFQAAGSLKKKTLQFMEFCYFQSFKGGVQSSFSDWIFQKDRLMGTMTASMRTLMNENIKFQVLNSPF
ncbi:unnamed protein product [Paramecium primaurelia]|uniref:Uncharacterized protein n=1 Tax=Paramecium primaurelia TaxID=5886 RepID=A0A8S1KMM8_PARPR|nr:unnamed protein product [Paramecium primaurelia]